MSHAGPEISNGLPAGRFVSLNDLTVVGEFEPLLRAHDLDSLDALFQINGERLDKPGLSPWRERLRLSLNHAGSPWILYLKRFRRPPKSAQREVRRSGCGASSVAGLEWRWLTLLALDGIPCPEPVALGEEVSESQERRSAVLTACVPGASLETWSDRWGESERSTVVAVAASLAALVARFHCQGYVHRDLYLSHVFYDPSQSADGSLCLIDVQRVMRPARRGRRWIVKDLAALNFSTPRHILSASDRLRWLRSYLAMAKLDPAARRLVYRVVGKTLAIARHERSRQARLVKRSDA